MRAILKLSAMIVATIFVQRGVNAISVNAAEIEFHWRLSVAMLHGASTVTPEFLEMARPLLGITTCESEEEFDPEWE